MHLVASDEWMEEAISAETHTALDMSSQGQPTNGRADRGRCSGHVVAAHFFSRRLPWQFATGPKGVFMIAMIVMTMAAPCRSTYWLATASAGSTFVSPSQSPVLNEPAALASAHQSFPRHLQSSVLGPGPSVAFSPRPLRRLRGSARGRIVVRSSHALISSTPMPVLFQQIR